ncbi:MAG: CsbD family protein [Betaproteobacteria bacterium]|nr:CsbD family protein [Betaproteobacteria bacterium]
MNKDQIQGRQKEAAGKIKEVVGKIVGDKEIEAKGIVKNTVGKAQASYGDLKAKVKKAVS